MLDRRLIYEEAEAGIPWLYIGLDAGLTGSEEQIVARTRRIARNYASAYGRPWPVGQDPDEAPPPRPPEPEPPPPPEPPPEPTLGQRGYEMRRDSRMGWVEIGEHLGVSRNRAFYQSKKHAQDNDLPWPLIEVLPSIGELAYNQRATTGDPWAVIGQKLNRAKDYCFASARRWAEANALTWPIKAPRPELDPHWRRKATGRRAYELRLDRQTWPTIMETLGISEAWAHRTAQEHAKEHGLTWPIVFPENDLKKQAYELRASGLSWEKTAEAAGCNPSSVIDRARKHALANDLPWPPKVRVVRKHSPRAEKSYQRGVVDKVPWKQVAEELGYKSCQSALNSAKAYARRLGLPYEAKGRGAGPRKKERLQQAYEMRQNTGATWTYISSKLSYRSPRSAFNAARTYARKNGLPWPPKGPEPEQGA
jgi:hypothetical protein